MLEAEDITQSQALEQELFCDQTQDPKLAEKEERPGES